VRVWKLCTSSSFETMCCKEKKKKYNSPSPAPSATSPSKGSPVSAIAPIEGVEIRNLESRDVSDQACVANAPSRREAR
jgi:hypothetical protein